MKTRNKNKNKKGFTLVELVVVVAILAVLAVTAVMSVGNISDQASDSAAHADANTIVRALNIYNAMAGTQITTGSLSVSALQGLNLSTSKTPPDLIDMALGVDVDSTRLTALAGTGYTIRSGTDKNKKLTVSYDSTSKMWIKKIA